MTDIVLAAGGLLLISFLIIGLQTLRRRAAARRRRTAITFEEVQLHRLAHAAARAMLDEARRGLPRVDRDPR